MIWNFLKRDLVDIYRGSVQRWPATIAFFGIGYLCVARSSASSPERVGHISLVFLAWYTVVVVASLTINRAGAPSPFFVHGAHQDYLRALPVNRRKMFFIVTLRAFILGLPVYLAFVGVCFMPMQRPFGAGPFHPVPFLVAMFFAFLCLVPQTVLRPHDCASVETTWRDWPRLLGLRLARLIKHAVVYAFWVLYLIGSASATGSIALTLTIAIGFAVAAYIYRARERSWLCNPPERKPYLAKAA